MLTHQGEDSNVLDILPGQIIATIIVSFLIVMTFDQNPNDSLVDQC